MDDTNKKTSWVIRLIIINAVIFALQQIISRNPEIISGLFKGFFQDFPAKHVITIFFGLSPVLVIRELYFWQIFTYMFLHSTDNFLHIFMNMYALLIFGLPVEQAWGRKRFLQYYLFTGVGAGISILIINFLSGENTPTIGASGAVFGLLLAFGVLYPNAEILLFFFIPIKAKYLVVLYGGLEIYGLVSTGAQSPISHAGHLGGLLFGIIYFLAFRKRMILFKTKKLGAKLGEKLERPQVKTFINRSQEAELLIDLLKKIKTQGPHSLTDDEYQRLKYLEIMHEGENDLCKEDDFTETDEYCKKCEKSISCLLREIRKRL